MARPTLPPPTLAQKEVIDRVMHEFHEGGLRGSDGHVVDNPRQAIAIALSEAGSSNRVSPERNDHALQHTLAGETRAGLLARAAEKGIPGRFRMTKAQLREALGRRS